MIISRMFTVLVVIFFFALFYCCILVDYIFNINSHNYLNNDLVLKAFAPHYNIVLLISDLHMQLSLSSVLEQSN